jgi:hypothetical protein
MPVLTWGKTNFFIMDAIFLLGESGDDKSPQIKQMSPNQADQVDRVKLLKHIRGLEECPLPPYYLTELKTCATCSNRQYWLAGVLLKHSNLSEEFF